MTLCSPMDHSPPGSSVHGILQARILIWVAISSSRASSEQRAQTRGSGIGRQILCHWATKEAWIPHAASKREKTNNKNPPVTKKIQDPLCLGLGTKTWHCQINKLILNKDRVWTAILNLKTLPWLPSVALLLIIYQLFSSVQFSSVAQSCPTLGNPMDRSTPGLPVHPQLPEFTQTHVHQVGDAMQPSHPLSSPYPPAPNPSQHQGLSNESTLRMRWPKYWSFSFNISLSNEHPGLISFRMDWLDRLAVQGTLKSLLQHHSSKASIFQCSASYIINIYLINIIRLLEWRVSPSWFTNKNSNFYLLFCMPPLHIFLVFCLCYYEVKKSIVIPILQVKQIKQTKIKTSNRDRGFFWTRAVNQTPWLQAQPDLTTRPWNLDPDPELFNPAVRLRKPFHMLAF